MNSSTGDLDIFIVREESNHESRAALRNNDEETVFLLLENK
jgi:hypothetical protein